jgi:hypothetical protein
MSSVGVALDGYKKNVIAGWLVLAGIGIIVGWLYFIGFNATWYALEYKVYPSKVQVHAKPKDCNFVHALLGSKECHYEAVVIAYNAAGELVGGDAPRYGHDTKTGKPIVSHDKGKTWVLYYGTDIPDQKINSVVVTWYKVRD